MKKTYFTLLFLVQAFLLFSQQPPMDLLSDIHPLGESNPERLTVAGKNLFFLADDGIHGQELWVHDGIETRLVYNHSNIYGYYSTLCPFGDKLLYMTQYSSEAPVLWISDGTKSGTMVLKELPPYVNSYYMNVATKDNLAVIALGNVVIVTDGTPDGTFNLLDSVPSVISSSYTVISYHAGFILYGKDEWENEHLWHTDGSPTGTYSIINLTAKGAQMPDIPFSFNEKAVFSISYYPSGVGLWQTDGTPEGTFEFKFFPDSTGFVADFIAIDGKLYFKYFSNNTSVVEVWNSDGTASGTHPWKGLPEGSDLVATIWKKAGKRIFLPAVGPQYYELWAITADSAVLLTTELRRAEMFSASALDSVLYFFNYKLETVKELWRTDGSPSGTYRMFEMPIGTENSYSLELVTFAGQLYFQGQDSVHGEELWISDGTTAGSRLLKDIRVSGDSYPGLMTVVGDKLFFTADDYFHGVEVWVTEGTSVSTRMVEDIYPEAGSNPYGLTTLDGKLYFSAFDENAGHELWRSDGTVQGTYRIKDIAAGLSSSLPMYMTPFNGKIYFSAHTASKGSELWVSNGTLAGTVMLKDLPSGALGSNPKNFMELNGKLYFTANGGQLWQSDGTSAGTVLVKTMSTSNSEYTVESSSWVFNGKMYFWVFNGQTGHEPWVSDGTAVGTYLLKDLRPGSESSLGDFTNLINFKDRVCFIEKSTLWITDGTTENTYPYVSMDYPSGLGELTDITVFQNRLYIFGADGNLWTLDSLTAEPRLFKSFTTSRYNFGYFLAEYGGRLWFSANDGSNGLELWSTDGTPENTEKLKPDFAIAENPMGSVFPPRKVIFKDALYFTAKFGAAGVELYKIWASSGSFNIAPADAPVLFSPNPTAGPIRFYNMESEGGLLTLYSAEGRLIRSIIIQAGESNRDIDLAGENAGVVFWRWNSLRGKTAGGKIILEK